MSEDKKTELNDDEIENVTGGAASTTPTNAQQAANRDPIGDRIETRDPAGSGNTGGSGGVNPSVKP